MKKILVVGDGMIDKFVYGTVERISPEAPAMVLDIKQEKKVLGGACNVAANIRTLSGLCKEDLKIDYLGFYDNFISQEFAELYDIKCVGTKEDEDFILSKIRFVTGNNQQLLRVDNKKQYQSSIDEDCFPIDKGYDLIVISDYNKNSLDDHWENILKYNSPIIFDLKLIRPKLLDLLNKYSAKCIIKCNEKEFNENDILKSLDIKKFKAVVETRGAKGFMLYEKENYYYGAGILINEDVDPTGAGDVFLAALAVKYLENDSNLKAMCEFGNIAAAEKVKHKGTVTVRRKELNG